MREVQRRQNLKTRRRIRTAYATKRAGGHRLLVFRSNKYIYAQLVDAKGTTLSGTRGKDPEEVGKAAATKAKKLKVGRVVFDRGGHKYHGRVKLLAEAARKEGLGL